MERITRLHDVALGVGTTVEHHTLTREQPTCAVELGRGRGVVDFIACSATGPGAPFRTPPPGAASDTLRSADAAEFLRTDAARVTLTTALVTAVASHNAWPHNAILPPGDPRAQPKLRFKAGHTEFGPKSGGARPENTLVAEAPAVRWATEQGRQPGCNSFPHLALAKVVALFEARLPVIMPAAAGRPVKQRHAPTHVRHSQQPPHPHGLYPEFDLSTVDETWHWGLRCSCAPESHYSLWEGTLGRVHGFSVPTLYLMGSNGLAIGTHRPPGRGDVLAYQRWLHGTGKPKPGGLVPEGAPDLQITLTFEVSLPKGTHNPCADFCVHGEPRGTDPAVRRRLALQQQALVELADVVFTELYRRAGVAALRPAPMQFDEQPWRALELYLSAQQLDRPWSELDEPIIPVECTGCALVSTMTDKMMRKAPTAQKGRLDNLNGALAQAGSDKRAGPRHANEAEVIMATQAFDVTATEAQYADRRAAAAAHVRTAVEHVKEEHRQQQQLGPGPAEAPQRELGGFGVQLLYLYPNEIIEEWLKSLAKHKAPRHAHHGELATSGDAAPQDEGWYEVGEEDALREFVLPSSSASSSTRAPPTYGEYLAKVIRNLVLADRFQQERQHVQRLPPGTNILAVVRPIADKLAKDWCALPDGRPGITPLRAALMEFGRVARGACILLWARVLAEWLAPQRVGAVCPPSPAGTIGSASGGLRVLLDRNRAMEFFERRRVASEPRINPSLWAGLTDLLTPILCQGAHQDVVLSNLPPEVLLFLRSVGASEAGERGDW